MKRPGRSPDSAFTLLLAFALVLARGLAVLTCGARILEAAEKPLRFRAQLLFTDANEGSAIADVNQDGRVDVIAGRNWFAGPDFTPRPLRSIDDWDGYVLSNGDHVSDVNGDGYPDVVSGGFMTTEVHWYENPGPEGLERGHLWKEHLLIETETTENEGQWLADLDGDGRPEWLVSSWKKQSPLVAWKIENLGRVEDEAIARRIVIGESRNGHGLGLGDLSGDGRDDLLFEDGWYERPADRALGTPWILHEDWSIHASIPMLVLDVDGDGRNDVVVGESHDYGLYWLKQLDAADGARFERHVIDDTFSQVHALHLADLDGDGDPELIAGKRVLAHNGQDPGAQDPPCLFYYQWDQGRGTFERFTIDEGRVGVGLQIHAADLDGNGRTDIVVAGKSGTYLLFNE